jgi:hypothetical protein
MQTETWKPIKDYEGWYEVSDLGRIRRIKKGVGAKCGRILNPSSGFTGYLAVVLSKNCKVKNFLVHRLVAAAFLPPDPDRQFVNHKDGVRTNAALSNLEWCTAHENSKHSKEVLQNYRKLRPCDVVEIRRAYAEDHLRLEDLATKYGVGKTLISKVVNRVQWQGVPGDARPKVVDVTQDAPEEWKMIAQADNYAVSNYGKVRNVSSGLQLKPLFDSRHDSVHVHLRKDGKYKNITLARCVAEAFIGPSNGCLVNHKNGDKNDNRANNLEYVPHVGCIRRAIRNSGGQHRT